MGDGKSYQYVAVDSAGRRVRGVTAAADEAGAFEMLRREGLSPLSLQLARDARVGAKRAVSDQDTVMLLSNLGSLLRAGADMRTALTVLGSRSSKPEVVSACRGLLTEISGGGALDVAFSRHFERHHALVGAMVAAGEVSGDLAGALSRAADVLDARAKLRGKLVAILTYPAFVLVSTVAAILALLLFVLPTLAPLASASGSSPPLVLGVLLWASDQLTSRLMMVTIFCAAVVVMIGVSHLTGSLRRTVDRFLLRGPVKRTAGALVYGGFAIALGGMLSAGAPMSEALRLATRSVGSLVGRSRLEPVLHAVRQGQSLSATLEAVPGFPVSISHLVAVGEATGGVGQMLTRAGQMEEEAAMHRIEAIGQILAPALIVALGGLVGLLMAGLLSGVSQLGEAALQ